MYEDDEFDGRNAVLRRPVPVARTVPSGPFYRGPIQAGPYPSAAYQPGYSTPPYAAAYQPAAYPWQQSAPTTSPLVDRYTGGLKLGLILEAAAQALAAMASLPTAPPMSGEQRTDNTNMVKYQESLAQHAKRDEQIRTIGALARLFLV